MTCSSPSRACATAGSTPCSAWSATALTAFYWNSARTSSASPATPSSSATRKTLRPSTRPSIRWCSLQGTKGPPSRSSKPLQRSGLSWPRASAASPTSFETARTAFWSMQGRRTTSQTGSAALHATPRSAQEWARRAASACCRATPSTVSWTTSTSSIARCSMRQAREHAECRLLLPCRGQEAGLPPDREIRVIAEHEPDHHVDARIGPRHRVRLAHVSRLSGKRDTEEVVGRAGLPTVLGDPDPLLAPELVHSRDERVDVSELHRTAAGNRGGRLARTAVVRMVRVGVEVPEPGAAGESHERHR